MRVLFAARDYLPTVGGLQLSVHQLARRIPDSSVFTLRADPGRSKLAPRVVRRLTGLESIVAEDLDGVTVLRTLSANGFDRVLRRQRPDAVVANAGGAHTHNFVRHVLHSAPPELVRCLYVRDVASVCLVADVRADRFLTNGRRLAEMMRMRTPQPIHVIPSIVEPSVRPTSEGRHVLFVNPVADRGLGIVLDLARRLPNVRFRLQESWTLNDASWLALSEATASLPNIELHRAVHSSLVYEGARALVVPYLVPNRPRVVFEAMSAGVPVIGSDRDGVGEAIGDGGLRVPVDGPLGAWTDAVERVVDDDRLHTELVHAGRRRMRAPDADPALLAGRFVSLLEGSEHEG